MRRDACGRLAASMVMVGFSGTAPGPEVERLAAGGVLGFILFARNLQDANQVRTLTDRLRALAGPDCLIAVDHEGGTVNRLRQAATEWPSQMALAAAADASLTEATARGSASELAALGIDLNFAPVADVLGDYRNPVLRTRVFSDDPELVGAHVSASVRGHRVAGVACSAKHFPGHGATPVDSHVDLPVVDRSVEELRAYDLVPFRTAIGAGVDSLMVSHVWYRALEAVETPATMSRSVIALAREELEFEGPIFTDCMEMGAIQTRMTTGGAVVRSLLSGCDMPIVSSRPDRQDDAISSVASALESGELGRRRAEQAVERIARLPRAGERTKAPEPEVGAALAEEAARRAVTLVRDLDGLLPLRVPAGEPLGVVSFASTAGTAVAGTARTRLADHLGPYHHTLRDVSLSGVESPGAAVRRLNGVSTVVVETQSAVWQEHQAATVKALLGEGKRVVAVGVRDPFDLVAIPELRCYLVTYDALHSSLRAACRVVFGPARASGRLPVELPGLYPRGHAWI